MPRLFAAIDLPEDVRDELALVCAGVPGARWLPPEQLHLTLVFIGEAGRDEMEAVVDELAAVESQPFSLALRGVGHFPPRGTPRVLWAGLAPQPALHDLQARVAAAVRRGGIALERRRFSPHVTLARLKHPSPGKVAAFIAAHNLYAGREFTVDGFSLYSSFLTPKGAVHTLEAAFSFG